MAIERKMPPAAACRAVAVDDVDGETEEYGDEKFESEDPSTSRRSTGGCGLENTEKVDESAALLVLETSLNDSDVQGNDGQTGSRRSSQRRADAKAPVNIRRERQERLIKQLTRDKAVLQRKVAVYQLALQLSADEDDSSTSLSFSSAKQFQHAAPPAFPRDGGTPSPSPRVARGWACQNPPAAGRVSPIERNLSYTTLVRQLDMCGRRDRMLKRENEALGARVRELESGVFLRAAQSKLSERDEEIFALREELSVMNRLARAQDRKYEGSQGYALARRLWLAEEELRLARSSISTLGAEVYGLRQLRKDRRRLGTSEAAKSTPDTPLKGRRQPSPRQPLCRRRTNNQENAAPEDTRIKLQEEGGDNDSVAQGSRSPTAVGVGRSVETSGSLSGSNGATRLEDGNSHVVVQSQAAKNQMTEVKAEMLQRALTNMRNKAKWELKAARVEINGLKEDKAVLTQALETKGREIRTQLLEVNRLRRELLGLSAGAIKLEEASYMVASADSPFRKRVIVSAAAAAVEAGASSVTRFSEGRAKTAAVTYSRTLPAGRVSSSSLEGSQSRPRADHHRRSGEIASSGQTRLSGQLSLTGWNGDWRRDSTITASPAGPETPSAAATATLAASTLPGEATGRKLGQASLGLPTEAEMTSVRSGGEGRGMKLGLKEKRQEDAAAKTDGIVVAEAARVVAGAVAAGESESLHPCPLAGLLDMSEPPLRNHRRSYYNSDDGKVYLVPRAGGGSFKHITEVPREEERSKCVVDFQGVVRHGDSCALKTLVSSSKRNSWASCNQNSPNIATDSAEKGPGQELTVQTPLSILPVRTWRRENTTERDSTGDGATARLLIASREPAPSSCVSLSQGGKGRLTPTISLARRPTCFAVESVAEIQ